MLLALLAIVIAAPFERTLWTMPGGFTLTTVEAVTLVSLAVIVMRRGPRQLFSGVPLTLAIPGALFLAALMVAALAAPADQTNALRFVARMIVAALLVLATFQAIDTRQRARAVVRVLVAVAACVASIAMLEAAEVPVVMSALTAFRPGFHVVAGQLRATSTLFYPTIASMYLEIAFALGLWLLLDPDGRRPRLERRLAFVALVIIGGGISATFTRAGLIGMAAAVVLVAALRLWWVPRERAGLGTLTALACALIGVVFVSHSPALLATRITTEGSEAWYGAKYVVPQTLTLATGGVHHVPISVTNTGRLMWDSTQEPAIALSYHWVRAGSEEVVIFEGQRTPFPHQVPPGTTATVTADLIAPPQPGDYQLVWDVVHETRAWFSTEGVVSPVTRVDVSGLASGHIVNEINRLPAAPMRPGRPALWSAALQIAARNPLLGIGPDNYRLSYGPYVGAERWDRRVHANNMYLEVLTGAGAIGLIALLALLITSGGALWRRARRSADINHGAVAAALAVWLMIAGHGLVDSFLSFTTTYVTFAIAVGLAFSHGFLHDAEAHAHRL